MSPETTGATDTRAESAEQPPAGNSGAQAAPEGGEQQAQPETISLEEARKLRSENRSLRERLKGLEDAEKARRDQELTETERLLKRTADLEAKLSEAVRSNQERTLRYATVASAAKLGFADPEDAYRLLDHAALEFEEDGTPRNVEAQLASLAKAKPYLLSQARPAGSFDTGTGGRSSTGRTYTREQLRDPKFYEANQADILLALREGRVTG